MAVTALENLLVAAGLQRALEPRVSVSQQVAREISRYVAEQSWGRKLFPVNRDLVGAKGFTLHYPVKEKSFATRMSDLGEALVGMGEAPQKASETFVVGARAEWSYAAEDARLDGLLAQEAADALQAIVEYENQLVYDRCLAGVDATNTFDAAVPGTFAYEDLLWLRKLVQGGMDYVVLHPTQMADVLSEDKFLRGDFITTLREWQGNTQVFETRMGFTFLETELAKEGMVLGVNSSRAGRFTVKKDVTRVPYDNGRSSGRLTRGVTLWEVIDAVVLRGDSLAVCQV